MVASADPSAPARPLRRINELCHESAVSWLPIGAYDGAVIRVGPLIIPGQSACFECTLTRLAANTQYSDLYEDVVLAVGSGPAPAAVDRWARAMAELIVMGWVGAADAALPGRLFTLTPTTLGVRSAIVFRVPRCPACGCPDYIPAAAPWESARAY